MFVGQPITLVKPYTVIILGCVYGVGHNGHRMDIPRLSKVKGLQLLCALKLPAEIERLPTFNASIIKDEVGPNHRNLRPGGLLFRDCKFWVLLREGTHLSR